MNLQSLETTLISGNDVKSFAVASKSSLIEERFEKEPFSNLFEPTKAQGFPLSQNEIQNVLDARTTTNLLNSPYVKKSYFFSYHKENSNQILLDKISSDRVTLLARKYINKDSFSDEELARVAIYTERLRKMLPAVTTAEIESLQNALNEATKVSISDSNIRKDMKLGKGW